MGQRMEVPPISSIITSRIRPKQSDHIPNP